MKNIIENWNYIKNCFNKNYEFLSKEEIELFEKNIKKIIREKKLKQILNI